MACLILTLQASRPVHEHKHTLRGHNFRQTRSLSGRMSSWVILLPDLLFSNILDQSLLYPDHSSQRYRSILSLQVKLTAKVTRGKYKDQYGLLTFQLNPFLASKDAHESRAPEDPLESCHGFQLFWLQTLHHAHLWERTSCAQCRICMHMFTNVRL